jgi:hypothetical protein
MQQRQLDAQPMAPAVILMRSLPRHRRDGGAFPEIGQDENTEPACQRLGFHAEADAVLIAITEVGASVPLPEPTP